MKPESEQLAIRLTAALDDFASRHALQDAEPLVGFSGGVDSTALLLLLHRRFPRVQAIHFHHGLRGEAADADEAWCQDFCNIRGIRFQSRHLCVPEHRRPGESCEEAGRRLRLAAWRELAGDKPVFLAHHRDDCLEELFLRLGRGSNASGLTGLRPWRRMAGLVLCRPLLDFSKSDLEAFVRANGVTDWCRDATNDDTAYRRNAVRNVLLPAWRRCFGDTTALDRSLDALRLDAECLEELARRELASMAPEQPLDAWRRMMPAIRQRALRFWLAGQGIDLTPGHALLARFNAMLEKPGDTARHLPLNDAWQLRFARGRLALASTDTTPVAMQPVVWDWRAEAQLAWGEGILTAEWLPDGGWQPESAAETFAADALPPLLTIRPWQPGDAMIPFGRKKPKKLQDLFVNDALPRTKRHRLPVVLAGETIIWVPEVRRAEFGRLTAAGPAIRLSWHEK